MANKKESNFVVSVNPSEVMYTNISTSKDGYNSARMVIKRGEKEYMSISCEWEGADIPGFAMDLMGFMKNNKVETSGVWPEKEEAFAEYSAKKEKKEDKKEKKDDKKDDKNKKKKDGEEDEEDMEDEEDKDGKKKFPFFKKKK